MKDFSYLSIKVEQNQLWILDQQKLPLEETWLKVESPEQMSDYILRLSVRGAPLIGIAAACSLAQYAETGVSKAEIRNAAELLRSSRPTAVNLMWAMDRMLGTDLSVTNLSAAAEAILEQEFKMSENMATNGAALVEPGESILTHCNTGGLATVGNGTALAVIERAYREGKLKHVYVDETRPLLQGGRLTTWELEKFGVPYTLICDNMAASLMRAGKIQRIFVGSDRIATNGDFANKIGTYSVAVAARHHNIPFHPVAPTSTIDFDCATGQEIPIEQRKAPEVQGYADIRWSPKNAPVWNPAFDVTPVDLVTSLVLDTGIHSQASLREGSLLVLKA